jgi:exopolysaccharide biosynthesis polyprenyl glycosylphosphotransferase
MASLQLALMAVDATMAVLLFLALSVVRFGAEDSLSIWARAGIDPFAAAVLYAAGLVVVLWIRGLYGLRTRLSARREALDIVVSVALLAIGILSLLYIFRLENVSRSFLILLFTTQAVLLILSRAVLRFAFAKFRDRGLGARYMLVVGSSDAARAFADLLARHGDLGLRPIGFLAKPDDRAAVDESAAIGPRLGRIEDVETVLHTTVVDEVAICLDQDDWSLIEPLARLCEEEGKIVRVPISETGLVIPGARVEEFDGTQVASLLYGPDRTLGLIAKRGLDVVFALAGLVLLSPILLVVAIAIAASGGRPILFRQVRVGLHGRSFPIVKFRTMVPDAEDRYDEVAGLSDTRGAAFKMIDDPRVTRLGRVLRATSIDELPQLWNVLRGEMSIVGPRPAPPREVADYDVWHRRRLAMKPGITGLWQVEARFDEEFDHRASLDLEYIDDWSLWLDLKIIFRTVPAIISNPGH